MDEPPFPLDLTTLSFEENLQYEERLLGRLEDAEESSDETWFEIGVLRHGRGDYAEAGRAFLQSAEGLEKGEDGLDLVRALVWASESCRLAGDLEEAEKIGDRALVAGRERSQEGVPMALSNLAMVYYAQGKLVRAHMEAREAVAREEALFGDRHPRLAVYLGDLLMILMEAGHLEEALTCGERILQIEEANFEPDHPRLASACSSLAMVLTNLGDLDEARRLLERAIAIDSLRLPQDHPVAAIRLNNLAHVDMEAGDLESACRGFRRALSILRMHFEDDHPDVVSIRESMRYLECPEDVS